MFAMLGGAAWAGGGPDEVIAAQVAAGLEVVTDGLETIPDPGAAAGLADDLVSGRGIGSVDRWAAAVAASPSPAVAVAAALPGPYSLARRAGRRAASGSGVTSGSGGGAEVPPDAALVRALADAVGREARALGAAGCPLVRVDEPDALAPADGEAGRAVFAEAHRWAATASGDGAAAVHLMLVLTGGEHAWIGAEVLTGFGYASYLFDLIAGPTDWRIVAALPRERGVVCGVVDAVATTGDAPEVLVWAAHYAASTRGRGLARVGLATTGSLGGLARDAAIAKIGALGDGARIAALPADEIRATLDPRALDMRSAALGAWSPDPRLPRRAGV